MSDNLKKFLQEISSDQEWVGKLTTLEKEDEVIALAIDKAAEKGIVLTAADFEVPEGEMNEDELKSVAGGNCGCVLAGGGGGTDAHDGKTYGCACVHYGQGGDGRADDTNCICIVGGHGEA